MLSGMMLGEVVSSVGASFLPVNEKLALADTVTNPLKSHVHGFGTFLLDGVVCNARCSAIVSDHGSGSLRMAELQYCNAILYCFWVCN